MDFLCLPRDPQWLTYNTGSTPVASWMRSVEYISKDYGIFSSTINQKRAVCARCFTQSRPAIIMIPARTTCPSGWTREYYGYLMASYEGYAHPSNYICVYYSPSYYTHSDPGQGGGLTFVNADCDGEGTIDECGTGEYVNNRQLTCVVCSR